MNKTVLKYVRNRSFIAGFCCINFGQIYFGTLNVGVTWGRQEGANPPTTKIFSKGKGKGHPRTGHEGPESG